MKEQDLVMYSCSLVKGSINVRWSKGGVGRLSILLKKASYFLKNVKELVRLLFFKFNGSPGIHTPFSWYMI